MTFYSGKSITVGRVFTVGRGLGLDVDSSPSFSINWLHCQAKEQPSFWALISLSFGIGILNILQFHDFEILNKHFKECDLKVFIVFSLSYKLKA